MGKPGEDRHQELRVLAAPAGGLGSQNPYIASLYAAVRSHGIHVQPYSRRGLLTRPDVIHLHWPELLVTWDRGRTRAAFDCTKLLILLCVAHVRGARIVWTGHNLGPHDVPMPVIWRMYWFGLTYLLDHVISLSEAGAALLRERYPRLAQVPMTTIRHGHYRDAYPAAPDRETARQQLGIPQQDSVLLILGQVRRYKGVDRLLRGFRSNDDPRAHLIVAGSASRDARLSEELRALAAADPRVRLILEYVPDKDVAALHSVADVVVLPYDTASSLNSGSALLALSMSTPIVVTDSSSMRELQSLVGREWVHLCDGSADDLIERALAVCAATPSDDVRIPPTFEWESIGAATVEVYRSMVLPTRAATATSLP